MYTAWHIIIHHSSISADVQLVCRLLCTNKFLRATVAQQCVGSVDCVYLLKGGKGLRTAEEYCYPSENLCSFTSWIRNHGKLLKSLRLSGTLDDDGAAAVPTELALAVALQQAGTLHLQGLDAIFASAVTAGAVLQQLPGQALTDLQLFVADDINKLAYSAVIALSRLTGLRSLTLATNSVALGAFDIWMPAVASMTSLTYLTACNISSAKALQYTPASLLELVLEDNGGSLTGPVVGRLCLDHLTALTKLDASCCICVMDDTSLPPVLQCLAVRDCSSIQPLEPLAASLRQLMLHNNTVKAAQLLEMKRTLTSLTELHLEYYCSDEGNENNAAAAFEAWSSLQCLKGLHLGGQDTTVDLLQQLGQLTSLTFLGMSIRDIVGLDDETAAATMLSAAIRQCTNLERLCYVENMQITSAAGVAELYATIARLPQLHSLTLQMAYDEDGPHGSVADAAVLQLAAATQLTSLDLTHLNPSSFALIQLSCSLTGLHVLNLRNVGNITDDHLAVVAAMLQSLTALGLTGAPVTDRGVKQLSKLTQLSMLELEDVDASEEAWRTAMRCV